MDFDNVHITLKNRGRDDFAQRIAHWVAWLESGAFDDMGRRRRFLTKRVYWNGGFDLHRRAFEEAGFDAFACRGHTNFKKSSADIVITLDAMDLLGEYKNLQEVIILTMDTDFVPLVNRLQAKGLNVVTMGNEENVSAAVYREHSSIVISLADMRAALDYEAPVGGLFGWRRRPSPKREQPEGEGQASPPAAASVVVAPPRQGMVRAPQLGRPAQQRRKRAPVFDLDACAARIVETASASPGALLSRATVRRVMQAIPGFADQGPQAWFGSGGYYAFINEMVRRRPNELSLRKYPDGGAVLVSKARPEPA